METLQGTNVLPLFLVLLVLTVGLGLFELALHRRRLGSIPIRVHVNGTRGKSSVTRLIGAGLRAGGVSTLVKVTGTFPKLVLEDGSEIDIYRRNGANILEQLDIVRFAAARKAEALVIECMALEPHFQWITEHRIVRGTVGVLTNVRLDHCDVMGQTLPEIAVALGGTIPERGVLVSGERDLATMVERLARRRQTEVQVTDPASVRADDMARFTYLEHEENVSLALGVCERLGVDRPTALAGMVAATPDSGALTRSTLRRGGRTIELFNAFAANDPDSTLRIWRRLERQGHLSGHRVVVLNTREDRADRSRQLAELIIEDLQDQADHVVLMGTGTNVVRQRIIAAADRLRLRPEALLRDLGPAPAPEVFEALIDLCEPFPEAVIVTIGNMGGAGAATVDHFMRQTREEQIP